MYTKSYIFTCFYLKCLVLLTMVPRNSKTRIGQLGPQYRAFHNRFSPNVLPPSSFLVLIKASVCGRGRAKSIFEKSQKTPVLQQSVVFPSRCRPPAIQCLWNRVAHTRLASQRGIVRISACCPCRRGAYHFRHCRGTGTTACTHHRSIHTSNNT